MVELKVALTVALLVAPMEVPREAQREAHREAQREAQKVEPAAPQLMAQHTWAEVAATLRLWVSPQGQDTRLVSHPLLATAPVASHP